MSIIFAQGVARLQVLHASICLFATHLSASVTTKAPTKDLQAHTERSVRCYDLDRLAGHSKQATTPFPVNTAPWGNGLGKENE